MRIRGQIGNWPVDLTVELEAHEWAQLGHHVEAPRDVETQVSPQAAPRQDDGLWLAACDLLRQAGQLDGPQLLARLEDLAGGAVAGKRLLVRLRHSPQVSVQSATDAPLFRWLGPEQPA